MPTISNIRRSGAALRDIAMRYPGAHEAFPWGETAIKVKGKAFLFMHMGDEALSLSCKLPASHEMALMLPFARPTGYGLGKSGWVSASFGPDDDPPIDLLRQWIDESYRAVAPKKLAAEVGEAATPGGEKRAEAPGGARQAVSKRGASKAASAEPGASKKRGSTAASAKPAASKKRGSKATSTKPAAKRAGGKRAGGASKSTARE